MWHYFENFNFSFEITMNSQEITKNEYNEVLCTLFPVVPSGHILYNNMTIPEPGNCIGKMYV
jgi:hypothetical protein